MKTIVTVPGCPACKKAAAAFKGMQLNIQEENLYRCLLQEDALQQLLENLARFYPDVLKDIQKMTPDGNTAGFICANPSCLPKPLFFFDSLSDEEDLQLDYVLEACAHACSPSCLLYAICVG